MIEMKKAETQTLAQNEATSVVFGMPKVAYERGGMDRLIPLGSIGSKIMSTLSEMGK